jgi:hypothetical protein
VLGRHVNREWNGNDKALRGLTTPFDWDCCALCTPAEAAGNEATAT